MSLLGLPNELILEIAKSLNKCSLVSLIKVNRHMSSLLVRNLDQYATQEHEFSNGTKSCALHWAAKKGYATLIRILVSKGVDLNCRECSDGSSSDETPLHFAAWEGHEAIIRLLIERGADANVHYGQLGRTPLHRAILRAHEMVVKALLEGGADVNVAGYDGKTALDLWGITARKNMVVLLLLLEHGVKIKVRRKGKLRSVTLREAVKTGQKEVRELIKDKDKVSQVRDEVSRMSGELGSGSGESGEYGEYGVADEPQGFWERLPDGGWKSRIRKVFLGDRA